jgi:phenylpropionate dioxygenase-like ring-hydroxylating dioxygenase large terminal subunit
MLKPSDLTWDDVVRVGAATPGGKYLRSFWWPVALSEDVRDVPVPVKLLGEELVLFRDLSGRLCLLDGHCPHRRASLEYGRIEEDGIRCAYHGWHIGCQGKILDRPAEPIKPTDQIRQPWYPVQELGGLMFTYLGSDKENPPPLPRYDVLVMDGYRIAERGDAEAGKAYNCNWLQGVENTTDTTHLTYLHGFSSRCPIFTAVENDYGVKLYILAPGSKPSTVKLRKRCTVLPTINRKSRQPRATREDRPQVSIQQAIWVVPIDDTHCEEMRITVYPEPPKERRYHGADVDAAKARERKLYDRRLYGEIKGNVPLEDKAMVESQGAIVDRYLEHPGYGDRAILLLRKMIREGIADLANGRRPKGVLAANQEMIDLDIGFEEYELDKVPEFARQLVPELQKQLQQASSSDASRGSRMED